eukprot:CAMPEP_0201641118 /NCGR_PEP_ID=MMETSP0493-20130528/23385_1 /ASSEMBLY_ACC=CAM_ASM_000838 /TAXON_ID=420259 /ORGANISM="Thalassiosira gravida, Strain GMp14c1" /LENGTH=44 /DNA_ID= /DNA_START= /DNA_END= /DNA_ORIENTATION=
MTWFQAFKIAFFGGGINQATGIRRRQLPPRIPQVPAREGENIAN